MYIIYHFTGNEDDSKFFVPQDSNTAFEGENFLTLAIVQIVGK